MDTPETPHDRRLRRCYWAAFLSPAVIGVIAAGLGVTVITFSPGGSGATVAVALGWGHAPLAGVFAAGAVMLLHPDPSWRLPKAIGCAIAAAAIYGIAYGAALYALVFLTIVAGGGFGE